MKRIIVGSILIVMLLALMPSVPAVHYKTAMDTNNNMILEKIKNIDVSALEQKLKDINDQQIQKALKSIDFSIIKNKINDFLIDEKSATNDNGLIFYAIAFLLTLTYQIILGRPSIIMGYFMVLSFVIIVSNLLTGARTPVCAFARLGFIPWVLLNLIGLIAYKTLPNKIIGFAIMVLFYLLSEIVVAMAFMSEINPSN